MNDLDKKLEEILELAQSCIDDENVQGRARDVSITSIKQAFTDYGWIPYKPTTDILDDQKPLWWSKASLMTVDEHKAKTASMITGQEWYDRFEREMDSIHAYAIFDNHDDVDKALGCAKRASGLNNEKGE